MFVVLSTNELESQEVGLPEETHEPVTRTPVDAYA